MGFIRPSVLPAGDKSSFGILYLFWYRLFQSNLLLSPNVWLWHMRLKFEKKKVNNLVRYLFDNLSDLLLNFCLHNALTKVPSSPNTDPPQFIYNLGHNKYSKSCEITFSVKQKTVLKFYLTRIFQQKV